jgi:myo-inositol-1(or 4)-monophosphatase
VPDLAADRALLRAAVRDAGVLATDLFARHSRGELRAWDKDVGHPASEADLIVDTMLKARLLDARPDYGWLSEESADDSARLARRRAWIVDPIDGTRDFLRGRGGWAVSVALVEDGEPILTALEAPLRGQTFEATKGQGATMNGTALAVTGRTALAGLAMPIDPQGLAARFWPETWDAVAVEKPNSLALRIAKVASGEADAFLEGRTISEWDIAAAVLLLTEAGGTVTDRHLVKPLFNKPVPKVVGLVAATPALHNEVTRRLNAGLAALAAIRRAAASP